MNQGEDMNKNNVGIVTGAGSGIGRAVTLRLLENGARVLAADRNADALNDLSVAGNSGKLVVLEADVSEESSGETMVQTCLNEHGHMNFLVNAAGIWNNAVLLEETPFEDFQKVLSVNLSGTFLAMRAALRHMKPSGGGAIVNTASTAAIRAAPMTSAYTASKFGVVGLTKVGALEGASYGVRVNALCPGVTDTPMLHATEGEGIAPELIQGIPMKRVGRPEDMAEAVSWLISDKAAYVTGVVFPVDGGLSTA